MALIKCASRLFLAAGFGLVVASPAAAVNCRAAQYFHDKIAAQCNAGEAAACNALPDYVAQLQDCPAPGEEPVEEAAVPINPNPELAPEPEPTPVVEPAPDPDVRPPENRDGLILVEGYAFASCEKARAFLYGTNSTSDFDLAMAHQKSRQARGVDERFQTLIYDLRQQERLHRYKADSVRSDRNMAIARRVTVEIASQGAAKAAKWLVGRHDFATEEERKAVEFFATRHLAIGQNIAQTAQNKQLPTLSQTMTDRVKDALSMIETFGADKVPGIATYVAVLDAGLLGIDVASIWGNAHLDAAFEEAEAQSSSAAALKAAIEAPAAVISQLDRTKAGILELCPSPE